VSAAAKAKTTVRQDSVPKSVAAKPEPNSAKAATIKAAVMQADATEDAQEDVQVETPSAETTPPVEVEAKAAAPKAEPVAPQPEPPFRSPPKMPGHMQGMHGRPQIVPRAMAAKENFVEGDYVVYPTHGVGKVERIATEEIAGHKLELIHITFEENRMTLRVPVAKARTAGLRKLATRKLFDEALALLKGRARIKRTMWSRRAQEYEQKINSGDPMQIAEVVRDLHRNAGQPDQSFSERQIYEAAMDRLAAELAALDQTDKLTAATKLADYLKTIQKGGAAEEAIEEEVEETS
jgi:CarD family transcriptional regulator